MTRRGLLAALAIAALAACDPGADRPAEPVWGKQPCAHCAMLVSEARFAAQATVADGRRLYFDDLGCMVAYEGERSASFKNAWVRDPFTPGWIDARTARYDEGVRTPMDFGFAPRKGDGGVGYDDVTRRVRARIQEEKR